MEEVTKVAHKILTKGDILRSPKGDKHWVVVEPAQNSEDLQHIKIACISKYMNKSEKELSEWYVLRK